LVKQRQYLSGFQRISNINNAHFHTSSTSSRSTRKTRRGRGFLTSPIKITVEISGVPISIETPDLEAAEGAMKLVQRFQTQHPTVASQVTSQSNIKVQGSVPKKPLQKKR
jgi:hypothetical protein